jgi:uncharacterized membrane protein
MAISSKAASITVIGVLATYPILIYFGIKNFSGFYIALILVVGSLLRLFLIRRSIMKGPLAINALIPLAACILIGALVLVFNTLDMLLYYPVLINFSLLIVFGMSLLRPPTIIECLARLRHPDLPTSAIIYTRNVTITWCCFFLLNGTVALYTSVAASLEVWTIYNGGVAYLLMGSLFVGEFLVRQRVLSRQPS